MQATIHGHEVIQMLLEAPGAYTEETLEAAIVARFGPDARFHTCSADDLSPRQLIAFLRERGKFRPTIGGLEIARERVCRG